MHASRLAPVCFALAALPLAAADLAEIKARGTLVAVAVYEPRAPEFLELAEGRTGGFDREVLEGFARAQGLKLEIRTVPTWAELPGVVAAGDADLMCNRVSNTAARRQVVDFTDEVFPTRVVVMNRRPAPPVASLEQLKAVPRLASIAGTSMMETLSGLGITKVDTSVPHGGFPDALRAGRIDAAVWSLEAVIRERRADPELQLGMFLGPPESLAYGVSKTSPALKTALNEHLRVLRQTGTWNRLVVKYFGAEALDLLRRAREQ